MRNTLKVELWKAFHNGFFYIAIIAGMIIAIIDAAENYSLVQELTERTIEIQSLGLGSGGHSGYSLFLLSLPYNGINYASRLYLFVWPILAALPFGWSYCAERRSGYYNQIVSRSNPRICYFSKYTAVFVSGGVAVSFPAVADILLNALICPYDVMDVAHSIASIFNGYFLSALYYTNPWVHAIIWCLVLFLLGGATAGVCYLVGSKIRLSMLVLLVPLVLLIGWDMVLNNLIIPIIKHPWSDYLLSPMHMVIVATMRPNPENVVLLSILFMLTLGLGIGYWQVKHNEMG